MPTSRGRPSRTTSTKLERSTTGGGSEVIETHETSSTTRRTAVRSEASGERPRGGSTTVRTSHYSSSGATSASAGGSASASSGDAAGGTYQSTVTVTRKSRSRSPLVIRRQEEKEEIAELNDRLAEYIDYVRHLDNLNQELKKKYKCASKVETVDVDKIKGLFENEIASLRRALDAMAKEKAALEVENRKMKAEWEDMKSKLARKEMECRTLERKLEQLEKEMAECRLDRDRYTSLRREYEQEMRQLGEVKKALEKESAARAEFEAKFKNVKKEMEFQDNLYKEEKSKWSSRTIEIEEEVESRARVEYESKLAAELALMREQTQEDMRAYQMQIDSFFGTKFDEMKRMSEASISSASKSKDELLVFRRRFDDVNAELAKKQAEVEGLMQRVSELEKLLEDERRDFEAQARMYREQNASLRAEMDQRFKEFNELMSIKVALDQEILAYRALLESEELRCHLSKRQKVVVTQAMRSAHAAKSQTSGSQSQSQSQVDVDEEDLEDLELASTSSFGAAEFGVKTSSSGPIEFIGCDGAGQFVTIKNTSSSDVVIGGWQMRYLADEKETLYKFPRSLTVKAGDTCTVWSSESHTTHEPPHNLVMKGLTFFTGSKVQIFLLNKENEMAVCEMVRENRHLTSSSYTSRRTFSHEEPVSSEERCSIM